MMNIPRFYCPAPLASGAEIVLPETVSRHAIRVLRLPPGAPLMLFDGRGGVYSANIKHIAREQATARIGAWQDAETESPLPVTLIQAIQAADKMDFTLQKAVELGVAAICPVTSRRSVVRLKEARAARRVEHWRGIVIAACEQSGRNRLPPVTEISDFDHWLVQPANGRATRLLLHPEAALTLHDLPRPEAVELLIGAEGGLDPAEAETARQRGFVPVRLGPRVLRTETAGLAALAAIQTLWGDFRPAS